MRHHSPLLWISFSVIAYLALGYLRVGPRAFASTIKQIYSHRSTRFDFLISSINFLIGATVTLFTIGAVAATSKSPSLGLINWLTSESFYEPRSILLSLTWSLFATFVRDGARTIVHYAMHKVPFLWEFHKLHHDAETLNPFTLRRVSPVELAITYVGNGFMIAMSLGLFIALFGEENFSVVTVLGLNIFNISKLLFGSLQHSNFWIRFPEKLACFVVPPSSHIIHHSAEVRHRDKNFASHYAIWDILLDTFYLPKDEVHFKIGIRTADNRQYVNRSVSYFYFGVFKDAYRKLLGQKASYEDQPLVEKDELHCWCGELNCPATQYALDNPSPGDEAYSGLAEIWTKQYKWKPISIPNALLAVTILLLALPTEARAIGALAAANTGAASQTAGSTTNRVIGMMLIPSGISLTRGSDPTQISIGISMITMGVIAVAQSSADSSAAGQSQTTANTTTASTSGASTASTTGASGTGSGATGAVDGGVGAAFASPAGKQAVAAIANAGGSLTTAGVVMPNGKTYPLSTFSSPQALAAAGLGPDATATRSKLESLGRQVASNQAGMNTASTARSETVSNAPGANPPAATGTAHSAEATVGNNPFLISAAQREQLIAGKTILYNGEPAGVRSDNLFSMVHRAYERHASLGEFITTTQAVAPAPRPYAYPTIHAH
jgi:sterol desaturase/sphingolipid hydroxylase (fatty acid hydroxylase superfamily)